MPSTRVVIRSSVIALVLVLGCSPSVVRGGSTEGAKGEGTAVAASESGTEATAGPGTSTLAPDTAGSTTGDACGDGEDTGIHLDLGSVPPECSLFEQDCDEGDKCVPAGWGTRRCIPASADPIADGEPCTIAEEDPCGPTSWCAAIVSEEPTCLPMCTGTEAQPECPRGTICVIDDELIVAYCAPPCDPLDPDACPSRLGCKVTPHGFGCVETGYKTLGSQCYEHDSCADGLACVDAEYVEGCCSAKCCAATCVDAGPCDGGSCIPFDPPVPGAPNVGHCG